MDHAGMEMDRVDLERYRKGLPPLKRKWIETKIITPQDVINEALKELAKINSKKKKKRK